MKILLLYPSSYTTTPKGSPIVGNSLETVSLIEDELTSIGNESIKVPVNRNLNDSLRNLLSDLNASNGDTIGFPLREYTEGGELVRDILRRFGVASVGPQSSVLRRGLDKSLTKKVLSAKGILTPKSYVVRNGSPYVNGVPYPLIVKPLREGGSRGIHGDSVVESDLELERAVRRVHGEYSQPALVEEFIDGAGVREFSVGVLIDLYRNKLPLPILEVDINNMPNGRGITTNADKVRGSHEMKICPSNVSEAQRDTLEQIAAKSADAVGCVDFGRVDIRMDAKGKPYVIEVNANPGKGERGYFGDMTREIGISHEELINYIVFQGAKRHGLRPPKKMERLITEIASKIRR